MNYKLLISEESVFEIEDAILYYKKFESEKLLNRLNSQINIGLDYISTNPLNLAVKYKGIRIYNLKNFPYQLHYLVDENLVNVIGFFHANSNPKNWNNRI